MNNNDTKQVKEELFANAAAIASLFGSSARLKILQLLSHAPRSVDFISETTGETVGNTSQHLQRLLNAKLVTVKKNGLSRIYSLSNEKIAIVVENFFDLTTALSSEVSQLETKITNNNLCSKKSLNEILINVKNNKAVLLDVRDEEEAVYSAIPEAKAIPISELKLNLEYLSKKKIYYVVCRGRTCNLASKGVLILRKAGFKAFRIKKCPHAINNKFSDLNI